MAKQDKQEQSQHNVQPAPGDAGDEQATDLAKADPEELLDPRERNQATEEQAGQHKDRK
jgi:hypothetical protein